MSAKNYPRVLLLSGYVLAGIGLSGFVIDFATWPSIWIPPREMGIVLGNGAIVFLGLVTQVVAKALRNFEERLNRLENRPPIRTRG